MDLNDQIIQIIKVKGKANPSGIQKETGKPRRTVFKALSDLIKSGQLLKEGKHPHIFYRINIQKPDREGSRQFPTEVQSQIDPVSQNQTPTPVSNVPNPDPVAGNPTPSRDVDPIPQSLDAYNLRQWLSKRLVLDVESFLNKFSLRQRILGVLILLAVIFGWPYLIKYYSPDSEVNRLRQQLSSTRDELNKTSHELYSIQNELNRKALDIKSQTAQVDYGGHQLDQLKERLNSSKGESDKLRGQIKDLEEQIRTLQHDSVGLKNDHQKTIRNLEYAERDKKRLQDRLDEKDNSRSKLEDEIKALKATISDQDKRLQNQKSELATKDYQNTQLKGKFDFFEKAQMSPPKVSVVNDKGSSHIRIDQIISWSKEGKTSQYIIQQINATQSTYGLNADDIQYLKAQHVTLEVIQAMQEASP